MTFTVKVWWMRRSNEWCAYGVSVELVGLIERNALARLRVSRELLEVAS